MQGASTYFHHQIAFAILAFDQGKEAHFEVVFEMLLVLHQVELSNGKRHGQEYSQMKWALYKQWAVGCQRT